MVTGKREHLTNFKLNTTTYSATPFSSTLKKKSKHIFLFVLNDSSIKNTAEEKYCRLDKTFVSRFYRSHLTFVDKHHRFSQHKNLKDDQSRHRHVTFIPVSIQPQRLRQRHVSEFYGSIYPRKNKLEYNTILICEAIFANNSSDFSSISTSPQYSHMSLLFPFQFSNQMWICKLFYFKLEFGASFFL